MSEQIRCPFCESAIPREALFCSRCGGKIPRTQSTTPGLSPRASTPPAAAAPPPPAAFETPPIPTGAPDVRHAAPVVSSSPSLAPAPSSSPPGASSSSSTSMSTTGMSVSQIQKAGRGKTVALVVAVAAVCVAAGWALGNRGRPDEPIPAVPAPAVVELGQPRVAVGAELPDPSRFLEPTPTPGTGVRPTKAGEPAAGRRNGARPAAGENPGPAAPNGNAVAPAGHDPAAGAGAATPPAGTPDPPASPDPPPADPPPADPGDPEVPEGALDTRAVIFVVRHYLPQVRACYERQLRNEPELHGQITMRFTVGAGGRVVDTDVVVNSTGSDPLAACVSSNLRTWRFPEPEGGAVAFEYPFRFGSPNAIPQLPGATQDP